MRFFVIPALTASLFCAVSGSQTLALGLDDFLPPQQGGDATPSGPAEVDDKSVHAETMQDGMAHAYQALMAEDADGVRLVTTKTGMGIIASASEGYTVYKNNNATLLSKRAAYSRAYSKARKEMLQNMEGLRVECSEAIETELLSVDTGQENAVSTMASSEEQCGESLKGMLAAYIVYSINDNVDDKTVTMTIASSTKTRSAVSNVGGAVVVSEDPKQAWNYVISEITSFAAPPMGAKLITNPDTGENIVIGYGSSIIRKNANSNLQRKLKDVAKKQAQTRSRSALVSFLQGDEIYWKGGFDERQVEVNQQFGFEVDENGETGDPIVYEETQIQFLNVLHSSDDYQAVTKGDLPPGVQTKDFPSTDGDWMFAISVYMPSATAMSQQAGAENKKAGGKLSSSGSTSGKSSPAGRTMIMKGGVDDSGKNRQGPSGQVAPKNDF